MMGTQNRFMVTMVAFGACVVAATISFDQRRFDASKRGTISAHENTPSVNLNDKSSVSYKKKSSTRRRRGLGYGGNDKSGGKSKDAGLIIGMCVVGIVALLCCSFVVYISCLADADERLAPASETTAFASEHDRDEYLTLVSRQADSAHRHLEQEIEQEAEKKHKNPERHYQPKWMQ